MAQPIAKFKVGQTVRLKPLDELKELGTLCNIRVERHFSPVTSLLIISNVTCARNFIAYRFSNYKELSNSDWEYHEDFLQPIRQLPNHLKGKL